MALFPAAKWWRVAFVAAIGSFLVTRALTLTAFPIFNDEALYLQYSQKIHDDWEKNRFISMNGIYADWKPPLQYWLAAPLIRCGDDPLVAGRAVAAVVSFLGLLGGYLFARELFSTREAVMTAWLFVLCPTVLFHNVQFTAETFLFSTAPVFYWALLKAMGRSKWQWLWAIVAVLSGTALLLFKQSASLLLLLGAALPLVRFARSGETGTGGWSFAECNRRALAVDLLVLAAVMFVANLAASLVIPVEFDVTRERFDRHWVMSAREILQLPSATWRGNLSVIGEYIGAYYSWITALFFGVCARLAVRRRDFGQLGLLLMCLAGGGAIIFLLREFNEYMVNTAVIAVLLPLLARGSVVMWDLSRGGRARWSRAAVFAVAAGTTAFWCYQIVLMYASPGRYIERSTRWAVTNYLTGWSTGFGVKEVVAMLEKEPGTGVIFADPQWGNPRTALEIYASQRFPKLHVVEVSREFLDPEQLLELRDAARRLGPARFLIFSPGTPWPPHGEWLRDAQGEMCEERTEVKAWPSQMPIVVCRF